VRLDGGRLDRLAADLDRRCAVGAPPRGVNFFDRYHFCHFVMTFWHMTFCHDILSGRLTFCHDRMAGAGAPRDPCFVTI
jgi:hypothetical protein